MRDENVVAVEMMQATLFDHLRAGFSEIGAVGVLILVPVETLDFLTRNTCDRRRQRRRVRTRARSKPAGDVDLPIRRPASAEKRDQRHLVPLFGTYTNSC
jgi:hypothetical protein